MKNKAYLITILYLLFSVSGSLYCIGEKTIKLGGDSGWKMADSRTEIVELSFVRPSPVLALSSSGRISDLDFPGQTASCPDLVLSFDEGAPSLFRDNAGHYNVIASPSLLAVDRRFARAGFGAALFPGSAPADGNKMNSIDGGPLVLEARSPDALFSPNHRIGDFTFEFWLYPLNLENGEEVMLWISARPGQDSPSNYSFQRILCVSSKNRLQWSFLNFFASPDGARTINIDISGVSAVVPKNWSHHLIRFDSGTGLIEYLMNGSTESIVYATTTGHEGGEVYSPIAGEGGTFVLGSGFSGMMDEFMIHGSYISSPAVRKYHKPGGRIETRAIDLGEGNNGILKVEASGGKTSLVDTKIMGEYKRNGAFLFSDDSQMQFFICTSDNPYRWDSPWKTVTPGADIAGAISGRYVKMAVNFYPSSDGEASPYLEELRIIYQPDEPPLPPVQLTAVAMDGAVHLHWKSSPDQNTRGYLVYYGTSSDDYFGEDAALGVSPVDAGKRNSIFIDGLKNGVLYYFRLAAYSSEFHTGEFSREVRARPLPGVN